MLKVNEEELVLTFDADILSQLAAMQNVAFTITRGAQRFAVDVKANAVKVLPGDNVTLGYKKANGFQGLITIEDTWLIISPKDDETPTARTNARTKTKARQS